MMPKDWIICDLDGTLCDDGHRAHLAQAKVWDEYHGVCQEDKPWEDVIRVLERLLHPRLQERKEIRLLIITGRPERYREITRSWLYDNGVYPDELFMRPNDSYEKAGVLKVQQLEEFFGSKEAALASVLFALDDSEKVVQAWRDYGIPCWQVRARL